MTLSLPTICFEIYLIKGLSAGKEHGSIISFLAGTCCVFYCVVFYCIVLYILNDKEIHHLSMMPSRSFASIYVDDF